MKRRTLSALKNFLRELKYNYFIRQNEKNACLTIKNINFKQINGLRKKKCVRIVFLVTHRSVWKVDAIFKKMIEDSYFEPIILVCPYVSYGLEHMLEELEVNFEYFLNKNYPVINSLKHDGSWVQLESLEPDIIFFTNPNAVTRLEYYTEAYSRYPSIYVPYYFMATKHAGPSWSEYRRSFYSSMWRIYWPHLDALRKFEKNALIPEVETKVYGYPAVEEIHNATICKKPNKVDDTERRLLIIYAPHHSIENTENSISTFLENAGILKKLVSRFKERVDWVFKPHPILRQKLYEHPSWGVDKTDTYFKFWEQNNFSEVCEGDYEQVFLTSDAIIHDCSSFLVEYLFIRKPCLYLIKDKKSFNRNTNAFGRAMSASYEFADTPDKISYFVESMIQTNGKVPPKNDNFDQYVKNYYDELMPSDRIISEIKRSITCELKNEI